MFSAVFLSIVSLCSVAASADTIPFDHRIIDLQSMENPWMKAAGDIDGDRMCDVVVGCPRGPLVWYRFPGWQKSVIAQDGYDTVDGELGDIDKDGDLDVVMGGLVWYENPRPGGNPAWDGWKAHIIADHPTQDIELGDLDNDGDLDIVTRCQSDFGRQGGHEIHIWLQESPLSWKHSVVPCPHAEGITLAYVDQDDDLDIVISGMWFENAGIRNAGRWIDRPFASFHPHVTVQAADINKDGRMDIIMAPSKLSGTRSRISWFEGPPDPRRDIWTEHVVVENTECIVHGLGIADMNNDGWPDIVYAEMHQGTDPDEVCVFSNKWGKTWTRQVISEKGSHNIRLFDCGNDGDIDILGANHGGMYQPVELWENRKGDSQR
jgi:hypothetical protein